MSLTPQQQQEIVDEVEVGARPEDPYAGPSSAIDTELQSLGPGDHVRLASLLRANPDNQQYILSVAATRCGNATVQRALQMVRDGVGEVDEQTQDDATAVVWDDPTTAREVAAKQYNDAHSQLVTEFNDATNSSTVLNGGVIDVDAVIAWQQAHDVTPDGKIGPQTVAAAKKAAAESTTSEEPVAAAPTEQEDNFDDMNGSAHDPRTYE